MQSKCNRIQSLIWFQAKRVNNRFKPTFFGIERVDYRDDLLADWRRNRGRIEAAVRLAANVVDQLATAGNVAAGRTEALGERAHVHVHVARIAAVVVDHTATAFAHRADAVRLIQVNVGLVLFLQRNHLGQLHDGALHAVDTLHDDHDLLPRSVRFRLAYVGGSK